MAGMVDWINQCCPLTPSPSPTLRARGVNPVVFAVMPGKESNRLPLTRVEWARGVNPVVFAVMPGKESNRLPSPQPFSRAASEGL